LAKLREHLADWVIDPDVASFFDTLARDLLLRAVAAHTSEQWILST